jgi:hypothetical protein
MLTPSGQAYLGCPSASERPQIKKWHKIVLKFQFYMRSILRKKAKFAMLYLSTLNQPIWGAQYIREMLDQINLQGQRFLEYNFRECLFYLKNLKSKIFKDPKFWGFPSVT